MSIADLADTSAETFTSHNPATGEVVGKFPIHTEADVQAAVARAREAAVWWREIGFDGRKERLRLWKGVIARRAMQLAEVSHTENGKPRPDAFLEIMLAIDHIEWAAVKAKKVLGPQKIASGLLAANIASSLEYQPLGVVGVIGPWNYPVFTPMGSLAYALAAGNAVVFKPSEYTPAVGAWMVEAFAQVVPEHPVLQLVTGYGETGAALCRAGVDKVAFTGSAPTGRKVMAACAETLTPVLMELGGKDSLILAEDGDAEAAADAALWGGMSNAGQTCIGTERVYVVESKYDEFVEALVAKAKTLTVGEHEGASYGPITMPGQLDVIRRHINDALDKGGRALTGGRDAAATRFVAAHDPGRRARRTPSP